MLKILDFERNVIGTITDYQDLKIERKLENGDMEISFTYLGNTPILPEYYVQTEDARYTIKEASPDESGTTYHGQLDLEDLQRTPYKQFTASKQTLAQVTAAALANTGWTASFPASTVKRSVQRFKALPLEILYAIRDAWMCEIWFDNLNKVVYFKKKRGTDKGVYFMRGLNLRKATTSRDTYDYVTRIIPYGADGLTIEEVNDGIPYVENYQYSTKILTMIWEDTSYDDAQDLMDDAAEKLEDLSKPKTSYDCDVIDLARMSEQYGILDYGLGDTIHLIDAMTGVDDKQRIVSITEYPESPEKNACELSNTVLTFEEIQNRMKAAADAWEDVSNSDGTVNGVYVHGVQAGSVVGIETVITNNAAVQASVSNVRVLYAQGNSDTVAPSSGWSTDAPAWDSGKYVWQKTEKTHTSGTVVTSDPTNITGGKGDTGTSVTGVTWYYKLQAASDPAPAKPTTDTPTGWSTTEPSYTSGSTAVLYVCQKASLSDGTFVYSNVSVSSSYEAAKAAYTAADNAMTAANGKNKVFHQTSQPSSTGLAVGDTWFDTDDGNKIYIWDGTQWTAAALGENAIADAAITNAKIANLDAGKVTTGTMSANRIEGGLLKLGGADNGKGQLELLDANDNVIASLNRNGLTGVAVIRTALGAQKVMAIVDGAISTDTDAQTPDAYIRIGPRGMQSVDENAVYRAQILQALFNITTNGSTVSTYGWHLIPMIYAGSIFTSEGEVLAKFIETVTNWNTTYNSKKPIRFLYGYNASNAPAATAHFIGIEMNISSSYRFQFLFRTNARSSNPVYTRHCDNGSWLGWGQFTVSAPAT